jgi:uncharacterized protein
MIPAPTELVVIQPTPFCNLDCSYCYLPQRSVRTRMTIDTVRAIVDFLEGVQEIRDGTPVVWHAGEPMVVPRPFYAEAFAAFSRLEGRGIRLVHSFQTNGTLLNDEWCEFIKRHGINVGVSIDGPEALHDRYRVDRQGRGTFAKVMRGVQLLRKHEIPFSVIAVLGMDALSAPDDVWEFIEAHDIRDIGFNVEEVEGAHQRSTLDQPAAEEQYEAFFDALYERQRNRPDIRIRELAETDARLRSQSGHATRSSENTVGSILNFDVNGGVSTFSPELLTAPSSERYPSFVWGNAYTNTYQSFLANVAASPAYKDMQDGIAACKAGCSYFSVCGGGAPSNKLGELGTLDGTETMCCRLRVKALTRTVLRQLELEVQEAIEQRDLQ